MDVFTIIDNIAHIDAHTEIQATWCQTALHGDGTIDRVLNCWKLDEKPVASQLDEFARMIGDLWFDGIVTLSALTSIDTSV